MKIFSYTVLVIIGFVLLGVIGSALNLITIPWLKFDRQVQMNRDIITKTYDADNALYNYHWFQEKAGEIKTAEQNVAVASSSMTMFKESAGERKNWTFEDKTEDARLRQLFVGSVNYYNGLVNDYNARAKEVDRAIFKDSLPTFFSLKPY